MNGKRQCYCKRQLSFVTKSSVFNFRFVVRDICERSSSTRIKIDYIWDPMKLAKYKTMSTWMKKTKVRVGDKVIKLQEERQLLALLMMIQQTRKLDVGTVIGMYEMTVIPRSLFRWLIQMNDFWYKYDGIHVKFVCWSWNSFSVNLHYLCVEWKGISWLTCFHMNA